MTEEGAALQLGYVVLHYRFSELTNMCLNSIEEHVSGASVLVVDNGSPTPFERAGTQTLRLAENICLAAAMNAGTEALLSREQADVAVQLNNDVILTASTHNQLRWAFSAAPRLGIAAPLMNQDDAGFMFHPCPHPPGDVAETYLRETLNDEALDLVPFVDNTAFAVRRETWEEVGPLEERFSGASWGANYDYCWRAKELGWLTGVVRSGFVFHGHRSTWDRIDPEYAQRAAVRMMDEMRLVWGELADTVSCREFVNSWNARTREDPAHGN